MHIINSLEVAGMFIFRLLFVLTPIFIGQFYGRYRRSKAASVQLASVDTIVAAAFGLLAFMLAFTFQIAADRYNSRRELLLDEVTNIRTAYLRSGLIPEPFRSDSRNLLVEYTHLRVEMAEDITKLDSAMAGSQKILDRLWNTAERLAEMDNSSEVYALFTSSVNDLVDNFNQRITMTLQYRIPVQVLWVLFIITFLSMLVLGYQSGISGKGSIVMNLVLAIIFTVVMFLILALDSPETGLLNLNQEPVYALENFFNEK